MRTERTCRAIVEAAAGTRPRYIHLTFWGLWFPVLVVLSAADPQRGSGLFAIFAIVTIVAQLLLPVACSVTFRRFLTRVELCVAWVPVLALTGIVSLMVVMPMTAAVAAVPEVVFQGISAGVKGLAYVGALGAYAAHIVAGRALRRLRWTTGDEQITDWCIWVLFAMYIPLGAAMLNPMLRRALATEKV